MPKDKHGNELEPGVPVLLLGRVKSVLDDEGRNIEVEIEGPPGEHRPVIHVNGKLLALDR